nr:hypothetical protein BaRGS_017841 [Batillaria attramentaria]
MRARFDEHKDEVDMRKARNFCLTGSVNFGTNRILSPSNFQSLQVEWHMPENPHTPDWLLDIWHPYEKAQYPEYFAKRELRKKEFIERWEKKYGKIDPETHH